MTMILCKCGYFLGNHTKIQWIQYDLAITKSKLLMKRKIPYVITNIMYELLILSNCMLSIANTITAIKTMNLSFITMSAFFNRNILMRLTTDISSQMSHKNHQIQWYIFVTSIVCYVSSCCILSMNEARQSKNF